MALNVFMDHAISAQSPLLGLAVLLLLSPVLKTKPSERIFLALSHSTGSETVPLITTQRLRSFAAGLLLNKTELPYCYELYNKFILIPPLYVNIYLFQYTSFVCKYKLSSVYIYRCTQVQLNVLVYTIFTDLKALEH